MQLGCSSFIKNKIYLLLKVFQLAVYKPVAHQSRFAIHIIVDCVGPQRHLRQALLRVSGEPRRGVGLRALGPAVRRRLVASHWWQQTHRTSSQLSNAKQNKQLVSRLPTALHRHAAASVLQGADMAAPTDGRATAKTNNMRNRCTRARHKGLAGDIGGLEAAQQRSSHAYRAPTPAGRGPRAEGRGGPHGAPRGQ